MFNLRIYVRMSNDASISGSVTNLSDSDEPTSGAPLYDHSQSSEMGIGSLRWRPLVHYDPAVTRFSRASPAKRVQSLDRQSLLRPVWHLVGETPGAWVAAWIACLGLNLAMRLDRAEVQTLERTGCGWSFENQGLWQPLPKKVHEY